MRSHGERCQSSSRAVRADQTQGSDEADDTGGDNDDSDGGNCAAHEVT